MTLREARAEFTRLIPRLIDKAFELGFEAGIDEATERLTVKDPTSDHMVGSLHHLGLALDLILWKNGEWQDKSEQYTELGLFWESLHPLCKWGGRFSDGNHFSFAPPELVGPRR